MANIKSSKKDIRRIEKRTAVNKARKTKIKTAIKNVKISIASGNKEAAKVSFLAAEKVIQKLSCGPVIHKNTAARRISLLSRLVKNMNVVCKGAVAQ